MLVLIDSDSLCYANAFAVEKEGELIVNAEQFMYARLDKTINDIIRATEATDYKVFLTSGSGFRGEIDPNYKANRANMKRPILLSQARDYLSFVHSAVTHDHLEADDAVCIEYNSCVESGIPCIVAHIDKDIDQLPGLHYRWPLFGKDGYVYEVSEAQGWKNLYKQALTGDKSDNIMYYFNEESGTWCKDYGVGPKTADSILAGYDKEAEMYGAVLGAYLGMTKKSDGTAPTAEDLNRNMSLLYMRRHEDDEWSEPETVDIAEVF